MIRPAGHRVVVLPEVIPEKTDGGIYRPPTNVDREQLAVIKGKIIEIGPTAWMDFSDGQPWAKVGDEVVFSKYGGLIVDDEGIQYRVLNDEDIVAIIGG
ncbi:MAG: co-chaperone GroES [Thermodesulfobacteriota bacterium]|nr:co-chaperone GroES [Thermodesulfobacteriota bacterium]